MQVRHAGTWGGSRPGAGRKPNAAAAGAGGESAAPAGKRVTLGEVLEKLRAAPSPATVSPPFTGAGAGMGAGTGVPATAPAEVIDPRVREENRSFANLVGYLGTNVGVLVIGDSIRKGGREPREPAPDDLDRTQEATAEAVAVALGDAIIPWWGALLAAWGNLYLTMRIGATPIAPTEQQQQPEQPPTEQTPAPRAPVVGQGVPTQVPRPPAPRAPGAAFQPLPAVEAPRQ